ncbi:MAG: HDOD domain-containing protein [Candidatus Contendobacter sp.]|nr:HDOD domain-containing protein [Candidatus Contendobacter sp.]MDG4557320.1 HDOD domain-containing protein [Candidatus Contendobacter sp.]
MKLPDAVQSYLDQQGLPYRLIACPSGESLNQIAESLGIPLQQVARIVLLKAKSGLVMAILPCSHVLDFSRLYHLSQCSLDPVHGTETARFFQTRGCSIRSYPPLPEVFDIPALIDNSLAMSDEDETYFDSGSGNLLVHMRNADFRALLTRARWEQFATPAQDLDSLAGQQTLTPAHLTRFTQRYTSSRLHEHIETITELPAMPQIAQYLRALRANPEVTIRDILRVIEQNPSLAAPVVYWARCPLHGHHGAVDSLETAITEVLGIENTLNVLLGSSVGRAFQVPVDGPVGLEHLWRHSVYCAALVGELVKLLPETVVVKPGLAYLSGLLHDFGYLALGHLFPARFFLFNRFLTVNRHLPPSAVERYVLGVEHWHIGAWLMQAWSMPEEVIAAVRWHHSEDCTQPHAEYSNLVLIANRLLQQIGLDEEQSHRLPALAMFTLGLTREQALEALARVQTSAADLDALAEALRLGEE